MINVEDLRIGQVYYRYNKDNKFGIEWLTLIGKVKGRKVFLFDFLGKKTRIPITNFSTLYLTQVEALRAFVLKLEEYCKYHREKERLFDD